MYLYTGLLKSGNLQIKCFYIGLDFAIVYITGTSSNTIILSTLFYYSKTYRVMIYNGDVDSCVPYVGPAVRYRKIATVLIYIKKCDLQMKIIIIPCSLPSYHRVLGLRDLIFVECYGLDDHSAEYISWLTHSRDDNKINDGIAKN